MARTAWYDYRKPAQRSPPKSDVEFSNRLKHLQCSDPVDPIALTRCLEAAITATRSGRLERHRRGIYGIYTSSRSPSAETTPRDISIYSSRPTSGIAPPRMVLETSDDDALMNRVVSALQACRSTELPHCTIEPQDNPVPAPAYQINTNDNRNSLDPRQQYESLSPALAKIKIDPSDDSSRTGVSHKPPPSLNLNHLSQSERPNGHDAFSMGTTNFSLHLPNLEPLSPFASTFSDNIAPTSARRSDEVEFAQHDFNHQNTRSPALAGAPLPTARHSMAISYSTHEATEVGNTSSDLMQTPKGLAACEEPLPTDINLGIYNWRSRRDEDSDWERSEKAADQIFTPNIGGSGARSSMTSVGVPSSTIPALDYRYSKLKASTNEQTCEESAEVVALPTNIVEHRQHPKTPPSPVSPLLGLRHSQMLSTDNFQVSPLGSPKVTAVGGRNDLDQAHMPTLRNQLHLAGSSTLRKYSDGSYRLSTASTTNFAAAKVHLRDSLDDDGREMRKDTVQLVQLVANEDRHLAQLSENSDTPTDESTSPQTGISQFEVIASGIALIDSSGSPTTGDFSQRSQLPHIVQSSQESARMYQSLLEEIDEDTGFRSDVPCPQVPPRSADDPPLQHIGTQLRRTRSRNRSATDATITSMSSKPDFRARPLMQNTADTENQPVRTLRPRTAGSKSSVTLLVPELPLKLPTKIKFPQRANQAELASMSPACLKLLHEKEALLRKRYDAVLSPIDTALQKRPSIETRDSDATIVTATHHSRTSSKSIDVTVAARQSRVRNTDISQFHNVDRTRISGSTLVLARNFTDPVNNESFPTSSGAAPDPYAAESSYAVTKSSFTFDDTPTRRNKGKWKFWG